MNINETVRTSLKNISKSKLRTLLTMLGIIIGIGSVILITSVGNGVKHAVEQDLNKMGMNVLEVKMNSNLGRGKFLNQSDLMTTSDEHMIEDIPGVAYTSPLLNYGYTSVQAGTGISKVKNRDGNNNYASFQGVSSAYFDIQSTKPLYGRFYNQYESKKNYAVIDNMLAEKLFGTEDAVGKVVSVSLNNGNLAPFLVVGVIENPYANIIKIFKGGGAYFINIPVAKMLQYKWQPNVDSYYVKLDTNANVEKVGNTITEMLAKAHHSSSEKYSAQPTAQNSSQFVGMLNKITRFVGFVAAISLVVGGIGVMNIMLVTVTERTREIGIRKAIGAKNRDILFQFLVESVILTIIGGAMGVLCGFLGSIFVANLMHTTPLLSIQSIAFAFLVSTVIGIVFGVYPARKASKLHPIDALRYE